MTGSARGEQAALVALLRTRPEDMTWPEIVSAVVDADSARTVWEKLVPPALVPADDDPVERAALDIDAWVSAGLRFATILDADYPARLRGIQESPPVLFWHGDLRPDDLGVSIVGSRRASRRGLELASAVAVGVARAGLTVISGLAVGIDTAALSAALEVGGRTVAVIGTGINRYYPAQNRELQDRIAREGAVVSQFWPDAPPQKHTFIMRNATMSGLGMATVVVEAGETSGARAQARIAVGHGRPVILTEMVVKANDWAKTLVARPGVYVAERAGDALELINDLHAENQLVEDAFNRLISA